jgi:hypothetical protein
VKARQRQRVGGVCELERELQVGVHTPTIRATGEP